jgi:copper resistance protein B
MNRLALIVLAPFVVASPVAAQAMDPSMPGMKMPMSPAAHQTHISRAKPVAKVKPKHRAKHHAAQSRAAMADMPGMAGMPGMAPSASPAGDASPHNMAAMPGMKMPGGKPDASMAGMAMGPANEPGSTAMADMPGMKGMAMAGAEGAKSHQAMASMPGMAQPEIPMTAGPPAPHDHAADRFYDPAAMASARAQLRKEHGGATISMVMANLAEYQSRSGGGGYRWEGQGWIGGDINRVVVKSEGEGTRRDGVDAAEIQGLYSHAIGPYFDLQGGVRQDFAPRGRTYVTLGFQGLAPYWFDVSGALFLSTPDAAAYLAAARRIELRRPGHSRDPHGFGPVQRRAGASLALRDQA